MLVKVTVMLMVPVCLCVRQLWGIKSSLGFLIRLSFFLWNNAIHIKLHGKMLLHT